MRPLTLTALLALAALGCGSGVITYRNVDTPSGSMQQYGAPKNTSFDVAAEISNDTLLLTIFQRSECDVIRVDVVSRVRETLRDGDVVHQDPATPIQRAEAPSGVIPCDQTYARDVAVSLKWGDSTYPLGSTTPLGQVEVSISKDLRRYLYADGAEAAGDASVIVTWQDRGQIGRSVAGTISGSKLTAHEHRIDELLEQMNELLSSSNLSEPKDILRSYQLYEELRQLDTTGDPRVVAVEARFLELFFERKRLEARAERKLDAANDVELAALNRAKQILGSGAVVVPLFMQAAVSGGTLSDAAVNWALGQSIALTRSVPGLCQTPFSWKSFDRANWDPLTRFTFSYDRYAYGESFAAQMPRLCARSHGW